MAIDDRAACPRSPHQPKEPDLPRFASFVLRCWTGADGHIRARLIDANSGVGHPIGELEELPQLVRRLLEED